jgi:hypothetical protein
MKQIHPIELFSRSSFIIFISLRRLGGPPKRNPPQRGLRRSHHVVSLGLEPLRHSLAASQRDQAREQDAAARIAIDSKPSHPQGLHLAFQNSPVIATFRDGLWCDRGGR